MLLEEGNDMATILINFVPPSREVELNNLTVGSIRKWHILLGFGIGSQSYL